jgi:membrane dipeptidase
VFPPLIFDAHLDLAMNALEWNRDLTRPLADLRAREAHLRDKPDRGRGTVCLPEMRRGRVAVCVATQIARLEHDAYSPVFGWRSPAQAWAMTQAQLAWYRAMEEAGEMRAIRTAAELEAHLAEWRAPAPPWRDPSDPPDQTDPSDQTDLSRSSPAPTGPRPAARSAPAPLPIGYLRSLEGADSLITPAHLARAHADGLRALGPAHYGPGVYAQGTSTTGPFPARGLDLLRAADDLGLILDVTHLSDECFWQALNRYRGPVWASHHNARALVPHQRQLADDQFRALVARDSVVGVALDAWMMVPNWTRGQTTPQSAQLHLATLADHIDHFCQLAGNARHVGLGTDLDGAFGTEQTPQDLDSIADLQKLPALLRARGYPEADITGILSENFLRFLRGALP